MAGAGRVGDSAGGNPAARLRRVLPLPTKPGWDFLGGIFCVPPKLGGILGFPTQVWVGFYTKQDPNPDVDFYIEDVDKRGQSGGGVTIILREGGVEMHACIKRGGGDLRFGGVADPW